MMSASMISDVSRRPCLSDLGNVRLKKVAAPSEKIVRSEIDEFGLAESNIVKILSGQLEFEVSEYPVGQWTYWRNIVLKSHAIGIQLHQKGTSYHIEKVSQSLDVAPGKKISLKAVSEIDRDLIHRIYEIEEMGKETREFNHFSLKWRDMSLPSKESFLTLITLFKSCHKELETTHVHCLSGRGRSGTFVYAIALSQVEEEPLHLLEYIRGQRTGLVETEEQESFALVCSREIFDIKK